MGFESSTCMKLTEQIPQCEWTDNNLSLIIHSLMLQVGTLSFLPWKDLVTVYLFASAGLSFHGSSFSAILSYYYLCSASPVLPQAFS